MITKEEFVEIINRLKETNDMVDKVNDIIRNSTDCVISDFTNAGSLMICHEDIVVRLLENMFNDRETINWWLYEKDYGRNPEMKMWDEIDNEIDVSTPEKLYDYLVENCERKKTNIEIRPKVQKFFSVEIFRTQLFECKNRGKSTKNSIKTRLPKIDFEPF